MKYSFDQKHVVVMGLGLNSGGVGVIKYLLDHGASLLVTDMKSAEDLQDSVHQVMQHPKATEYVVWKLGCHQEEDFMKADYVVRNPSVPQESKYIQIALEHNIEVITDLEIFFDALEPIFDQITVIGITGTRGKSTTTSWIHYILMQEYGESRVHIGGNIRKSAISLLADIKSGDYIVLELSSFQLETLHASPHIAVFTSFFQDHLNRHKTMDVYFEIKSHLFMYQTSENTAVLNMDSEYIHSLEEKISSRIITFSKDNSQANCYIQDGWIYVDGQPYITVTDLSLRQEHNKMNAMASILATKDIVSESSLRKGLTTFAGVPGRQEYLGEVEGVQFINDTTSTSVNAILVALESFQDTPVHLLCGGNNKNLDYSEFGQILHSTQVQSIHFLPGDASHEMIKSMRKNAVAIPYQEHETLKDAFDTIIQEAKPGSTILFSPGGTSFGLFANEFDRGDQFVALFTEYAHKKNLA